MQNVLNYGRNSVVSDGVINGFISDAGISWVEVEDLAQVAALSMARPDLHAGKTYRLGYAVTMVNLRR